MALFSNKQESNLRSCIQMVEDVITSLGHTPDESRAETDGLMPAWQVCRGSAWVTVAIAGTEGDEQSNHLQVAARVMVVDDTVDRVRLFQRLLELNVDEIKGAAFGLEGDTIMLILERSTIDLDPSEVHDAIARVEEYADKWDDLLVREFGGKRAGDGVIKKD
jgi:hypothetical protein